MELLLGCGDVDPYSSDVNDLTPLLYAAIFGAPGAVGLLLESRGVNPNSLDGSGRTPLPFSASRGHGGLVNVLLRRRDTNPNLSDGNGLIAMAGHPCHLLLSEGVKV